MAAKKKLKSLKQSTKNSSVGNLLQINFKLTNMLGAGAWEWFMETGKSTTADSGRSQLFFCICSKYSKTGSSSERLRRFS